MDHQNPTGIVHHVTGNTETPDDNVDHFQPQKIETEASVQDLGISSRNPRTPKGTNKLTESGLRVTTGKPQTDNWRPWLLRWPILLLLAVLHLIYVGALQAAVRQASDDEDRIEFTGNDHGRYFVWQFLAVLGAAILGNIWEAVDVNIRRLQPYLLMARDSGAAASESLLLDYVTEFSVLVPFLAAGRRHWLVFLSSLSYAAAAMTMPALSTQMWDVLWEDSDEAAVEIRVTWIRALQAINAVLAVSALGVFVMLMLTKSRLVREPAGPISLASILCSSSDLRQLLRQLPPAVSHTQLKSTLEPFRFHLQRSDITGEDSAIGIKISSAWSTDTPDLQLARVPASIKPKRSEAHPWWLWGRFILLEELILLAPYITVQVASGHFGLSSVSSISPWVAKACYTAGFTVVVLTWQSLQRELSILEPYYQLATFSPRHDGTSRLPVTLDYISQPPLYVIVYAFITSASLLGFVTLISLFQQCAVVFMPPIWKSLYEQILVDAYSEVPPVVLRSLIVVAAFSWPMNVLTLVVVIFLIRRRRKPILPRQPTTLASQLLYLCGSEKLLGQVRGTSLMSSRELRDHVKAQDKRYSCGWFKTTSGSADEAQQEGTTVWRLGIEEFPVDHLYRFPETTPLSN